MKETIDKRYVMWMIIIRVITMTLLLVVALVVGYSANFSFPLIPLLYIVGASYLLSAVFLILYLTGKHLAAQAYGQVITDLILVTALVYAWGGISNPAYILYLLPVIEAGLVISGRASYLAAALAAISFGLIVDGMYYGLIPYPPGVEPDMISFGSVVYSIFVAWGAFFIVAFLTSTLSSRLRKTHLALVAAQKELALRERLAEAGRVSAVLAHEVRNPLAAIYGSVQMLKDRIKLSNEQKELMEIIMRESQRVSSILDQFLDYALPAKETFTHVRLADVAGETIKLLAASGDLDGRVRVGGNFRESGLAVHASTGQMKQVFLNVVKNALRAMPDGGQLKIDINPKPEGMLEIVFADTGVGMSREDSDRLFDPFFSRFEGGRGLGLAIVRRIVDDYNGRIGVNSGTGRGTEVRIELPAENGRMN